MEKAPAAARKRRGRVNGLMICKIIRQAGLGLAPQLCLSVAGQLAAQGVQADTEHGGGAGLVAPGGPVDLENVGTLHRFQGSQGLGLGPVAAVVHHRVGVAQGPRQVERLDGVSSEGSSEGRTKLCN